MGRKRRQLDPDPDNIKDVTIEDLVTKYAGLGAKLGNHPSLPAEFIPTGIAVLDKILGGGIPRNRVSILLGDYATGKTFICQKIIAHAQSLGLLCGFVDAEMKISPDWFVTTGVDITKLLVIQNNIGEEVLDAAMSLVEELDILFIDSIPALVPVEEVNKSMKEDRVASQARMTTKFFQRVLPHLNKDKTGSRCALVFTNHVKSGIGGYIPVENYPGGKAQKFYSSIILRISRSGWATVPAKFKGKDSLKRVGFDIVCKAEKNSLTSPFQKCSIPFSFDGTVDPVRALGRMGLDEGIIIQHGPYYEYHDIKEQGRSAFLAKFRERPDLQDKMERELLNANFDAVEVKEEEE